MPRDPLRPPDRRSIMRFSRTSFLAVTLGSVLGLLPFLTKGAEPPSRPNIVFILADDLGYGDLGCFGQEKIRTPRLDRMAREGIRLTSHYSGHNICSPSRCALMTGKHMGHASVTGNGGRLRASDLTVPMILKKAGYRTCMIGKWGLVGRPGHPGSPNNKGFDHFFGFDNQGFAHFYYPEYLWRNDQKVLYPKNHNLRVNGQYREGAGTYSHDELLKEALGWIRKNQDHPFFLYLPFCIPHAELTVPRDSMDPYLPELLGRTTTQKKHEFLYWPGAIRVGKWKLHRYGPERFALYDLENDLAEQHNLAKEHPEVINRCRHYFEEARKR